MSHPHATAARARVPYLPTRPVRAEGFESLFARLTGRQSAGAAKQAILRAKRDFERALECAIRPGFADRYHWLMEKVDRLAGQRAAPPLADAIARKSEIDGTEDGALTRLAMSPDDEGTARQAYRHLLLERRAADDLLAALNDRWAFEV